MSRTDLRACGDPGTVVADVMRGGRGLGMQGRLLAQVVEHMSAIRVVEIPLRVSTEGTAPLRSRELTAPSMRAAAAGSPR